MEIETSFMLAVAGLMIGIIFGVVVQRSRFCMTAVVSHWVLMKDARQMHAYLVALVVAIVGAGLLESSGLVDLSGSVYRNAEINWLSMILGGCIFGLGAVFAGGCIGRILSLAGEGNLGAVLALLTTALGATAAYTGVLAPLRIWIHELAVFEVSGGDASILSVFGMPSWIMLVLISIVFIPLLLHWRYKAVSHGLLVAGAIVGLLVVAGWLLTGYLLVDDFEVQAPYSLTFSGPLARTTLYLTMAYDVQKLFGVMLLGGVLLGSFISAICTGSFRLALPASVELPRILAGGLMMGAGAMLAQGCNIGQGLTGLSTLSIESVLAVTSIFIGMYAGVRWLQYAEMKGSLWDFFHWQHTISRTVTS